MDNKKFKLSALSFALSITLPLTSLAATPIDVSTMSVSYLKNYLVKPGFNSTTRSRLEEQKQQLDFNRTLHMRAHQTYAGFPVWGADIAVHITNANGGKHNFNATLQSANTSTTKMNGKLYQDLDRDLHDAPAYLFSKEQMEKAYQNALSFFQREIKSTFIPEEHETKMMVYVDKASKAHWAFYVRLYGKLGGYPTLPTYIIDATKLTVHRHWNDIKLRGLSNVKGGGYGGNVKMGRLVYDGDAKQSHLPALDMQRDNKQQMCYLQNKDAVVYNFKTRDVAQFKCIKLNAKHNNLYWNQDFDFVNGGYSPSNDALYAAKVITSLYQTWYQIPVLEKYEAPMQIVMIMHTSEQLGNGFPEQAIWDDLHKVMFFGDGQSYFYPLTSIDVAAHEISHGFTSQHAAFSAESGQSAGLDEAFSDMAGQAAQYFVNGKNDWKVGADIVKQAGEAFRYLDRPSKDCKAQSKPGVDCSIDNMEQYEAYKKAHEKDVFFDLAHFVFVDNREPDEHFSNGIFNRAFYLMSTAKDWNVRKAFDVMVQANRYYWTSTTDFREAACGVVHAAKDLHYDVNTVASAFADVKIDINDCDKPKVDVKTDHPSKKDPSTQTDPQDTTETTSNSTNTTTDVPELVEITDDPMDVDIKKRSV